MTRRGFLGALLGTAVSPDPERLLWVPGRKLISIPRSNVIAVSPDWIARESLRILQTHIIHARVLQREYNACLSGVAEAIANEIVLRKPLHYRGLR